MGVVKGLGGIRGVVGIGVATVIVAGSALAVAGFGADGSLVLPPAVPAEASSVSGILAERCDVQVPTDH